MSGGQGCFLLFLSWPCERPLSRAGGGHRMSETWLRVSTVRTLPGIQKVDVGLSSSWDDLSGLHACAGVLELAARCG
jgi:hypothetical protein